MAVSLYGARVLTLPYDSDAKTLVLAVYRATSAGTPATPVHVDLFFEGIDARHVRIEISSNGPVGDISIASNALAGCTPHIGSFQRLSAAPESGAIQAADVDGHNAGDARIYSGTFDAAIARQDCELTVGAHRDDFSALRLGILAGYRFFTQDGGAQFIPADARLRPVERYTLHFDASIEHPIFEGAGVVQREQSTCELTADAAAVVVRWRDEHRAGIREFGLFILAGGFAIGASMLVELVKPRFLE